MPRTKKAFAAYDKGEADMKDFASYTGGEKKDGASADFEEQARILSKQYEGKSDG